jgi:hypothetical protein
MDYLTKSVFFGSRKDFKTDSLTGHGDKKETATDSSQTDTWRNPISHLIEPNIKYMLYSTLKRCHDYRAGLYNSFFNLSIFTVFIIVFGGALYYCYKKKPSPEEVRAKMVRDQNYILAKIRFYQNEKMKEREHETRTSNITKLPVL